MHSRFRHHLPGFHGCQITSLTGFQRHWCHSDIRIVLHCHTPCNYSRMSKQHRVFRCRRFWPGADLQSAHATGLFAAYLNSMYELILYHYKSEHCSLQNADSDEPCEYFRAMVWRLYLLEFGGHLWDGHFLVILDIRMVGSVTFLFNL